MKLRYSPPEPPARPPSSSGFPRQPPTVLDLRPRLAAAREIARAGCLTGPRSFFGSPPGLAKLMQAVPAVADVVDMKMQAGRPHHKVRGELSRIVRIS